MTKLQEEILAAENKNIQLMRANNIYVPLFTVGSVVVAIIVLVWQLSQERAAVYSRIDQVDIKVVQLTDSVSRFISAIDARLERGGVDRYTRTDAVTDCLRTQILNPGWKCRYTDKGSVESWEAGIEQSTLP